MNWHAELAIFLDEAWRLSWVDVDPTVTGRPYSQRFKAWHIESIRLDSETYRSGLRKRETRLPSSLVGDERVRDVLLRSREEVLAAMAARVRHIKSMKV